MIIDFTCVSYEVVIVNEFDLEPIVLKNLHIGPLGFEGFINWCDDLEKMFPNLDYIEVYEQVFEDDLPARRGKLIGSYGSCYNNGEFEFEKDRVIVEGDKVIYRF